MATEPARCGRNVKRTCLVIDWLEKQKEQQLRVDNDAHFKAQVRYLHARRVLSIHKSLS